MLKFAWGKACGVAACAGGMAASWHYGATLERQRVARVERVTASPKMLMLFQDPLIQSWQRGWNEGWQTVPAEHRAVFEAAYSRRREDWPMAGDLFQPKAHGVPTFAPVKLLLDSWPPRTVLEEHPPVWTSGVSRIWLAGLVMLVFPIPLILAFRAGCLSIPGPTGCLDNTLLRCALLDPVLQYFLARADDMPFRNLFEPNLNMGTGTMRRCHGFFSSGFSLHCECECCVARFAD